jgi:hypothetical protein
MVLFALNTPELLFENKTTKKSSKFHIFSEKLFIYKLRKKQKKRKKKIQMSNRSFNCLDKLLLYLLHIIPDTRG